MAHKQKHRQDRWGVESSASEDVWVCACVRNTACVSTFTNSFPPDTHNLNRNLLVLKVMDWLTISFKPVRFRVENLSVWNHKKHHNKTWQLNKSAKWKPDRLVLSARGYSRSGAFGAAAMWLTQGAPTAILRSKIRTKWPECVAIFCLGSWDKQNQQHGYKSLFLFLFSFFLQSHEKKHSRFDCYQDIKWAF